MKLGQKRSMLITREGVYFLVIAGCIFGSSFIQRVNLLVLIFGMMLVVIFLGVCQAWRLVGRVAIERKLPAEAFANLPFEVGYVAKNLSGKRVLLGLSAYDESVPALGEEPPLANFAEIPRSGSRRANYKVMSANRGVYKLQKIVVTTTAPLGLVEVRRNVAAEDRLLVFPALGKMTPLWRQKIGRANISATLRSPTPDRSQDEFHGLRDYRLGDNPRHIHWRTTARRGQLVVKEFESVAARDIVLLLDPFADPKNRRQLAALEMLLQFTATAMVDLNNYQRGMGGRIVLAGPGSMGAVIQGQPSPRLLRQALITLAELQPSRDEDFLSILQRIGPNQVSQARIWWLGTRPLATLRDHVIQRFGSRKVFSFEMINFSTTEYRRWFVPGEKN